MDASFIEAQENVQTFKTYFQLLVSLEIETPSLVKCVKIVSHRIPESLNKCLPSLGFFELTSSSNISRHPASEKF